MSAYKELAQSAVDLSKKRGAKHSEALVVHERQQSAEAFDSRIRISGTSEVTTLTLRVFRNQRGGIASARGVTERSIAPLVDAALAACHCTSQDKFLGPPESDDIGRADNDLELHDEQLAKLTLNRVADVALAAESAVIRKNSDLRRVITSSFQVATKDTGLCTSSGFCESYRTTTAVLLVRAIREAGNEAPSHSEKLAAHAGSAVRQLSGLDIDAVATRTVERLRSSAGARPARAGSYPVVFSPLAAANIISAILSSIIDGAVTLSRRSVLGSIGDRVCSPLVSLVDDPGMTGGLASAPFDHEAVKPRQTILIDKGVLSAYLLNSYYARVLDRETTGNAVISDDARFDVTPSNSFIEAGQSEPESIIADVSSGLYVTRYLSFGVPAADHFSQAVQGFWIENGKLSYPVRAATVSSGLREMLMNIEGVGNDLNTGLRFASPTLLISKMDVASMVQPSSPT